VAETGRISVHRIYTIYNVSTQVWEQNVLAFLMGLFSSSLFVPKLISVSQRSVRPVFVGRASGLYMTFAYGASTVAGYLFAWLVGLFGWGGAGFVQLSLIPIAGIVALIMVNNRTLFQPNRINKASASA
jgi:MFS family permease